MLAFPPCKINLGLQILHRRNDGFHDLASVMAPVNWRDILEIVPDPHVPEGHCSFSQSGIPVPGNAEDNLCIKAYRNLQRQYSLPGIKMHLHKVIPFGAGLGGGSSDGASALLLLHEIFQLGLTKDQLLQEAARLGSDCPVFIQNKACLATGRGEILQALEPLGLDFELLLVKPGFGIGTAEAYQDVYKQEGRPSPADILRKPVTEWKAALENDFERHLFRTYPTLAAIKEKLYESGAEYAAMSGSGSTVFGLYKKGTRVFPEFPSMTVFSTGFQL